MAVSIHDLVLFVSSTSKICAPVVYFIRNNGLPVRLVRLDTQSDRELAATGNKAFQIHTVPTLLATYSNGELGLYVGQEKIIEWLKNLIKPMNEPPVHHQEYTPEHGTQLIPEEEIPRHVKKKPKKRKEKPVKQGVHGNKKKNIYDGKKPKKNKKPPVNFEESDEDDSDEEIEIEYLDSVEPKRRTRNSRSRKPQGPPTNGLMVGQQSMGKKNNQMNSLYEQAKQMAKDRENTLGYNESDLPVRS